MGWTSPPRQGSFQDHSPQLLPTPRANNWHKQNHWDLSHSGAALLFVLWERGTGAFFFLLLPSAWKPWSPKMQGLPPLVQAKRRPRCCDSLPKGMRIVMPSAALAMQSMGCRNHLFKLNKDHSGHSGQVAMLLMHAGLWVCAKDCTVKYDTLLTLCASHAAHCKVEGHTRQPWWQCPPNYGCLLHPAGLGGNRSWTEMLQKNCAKSAAPCTWNTYVTFMQGMFSVPSWMQNILLLHVRVWCLQMLTCPHLFQILNFRVEIIKIKKEKNLQVSFRSA